MPVLLESTFTLHDEAASTVGVDHAQSHNDVPGLVWKIWLRDPDSKTNGGIHLFTDRPSAETYLAALQTRMDGRPDVTDFHATIFDIKEEATRITHGPIDVARAAPSQ